MEEWKICILHHPPKLSFIIAKQKKIRVNNFINIIVVFFYHRQTLMMKKKKKRNSYLLTVYARIWWRIAIYMLRHIFTL